MSVAKFNKVVFAYIIPPTHEFKTLGECFKNEPNKVYRVNGLYINKKSKYGDSPIIITDECMFNLPKHMLVTVSEMMGDSHIVELINEGKVGFTIYSYRDGLYSIKWLDI